MHHALPPTRSSYLQGGVANQILQYAAVGAAAARSGRLLFLDHSSLRTGLRGYGPDAFR